MNDFARLLIIFLAAVNPAGALVLWSHLAEEIESNARRLGALSAVILAFALYWLAVLVGPDLLEFLDISESSFQIAAGSLLAAGGLFVLFRLNPFERSIPAQTENLISISVFWLAFWIANPAALAAAIWYGIDQGQRDTLPAIASALIILAGLLLTFRLYATTPGYVIAREIGRLTAALVVVIGFGLIVGGVLNV